jgi:hypothetical protein
MYKRGTGSAFHEPLPPEDSGPSARTPSSDLAVLGVGDGLAEDATS